MKTVFNVCQRLLTLKPLQAIQYGSYCVPVYSVVWFFMQVMLLLLAKGES